MSVEDELPLDHDVMVQRVDAALATMPEPTFAIFAAFRFDGLSYDQIAKCHGMSVRDVERHIALALRHLHATVFGPG